jgi:hypothetical protein
VAYMNTRRRIAHHEARQLRNNPPRLWPYVTQEARAAILLAIAHGRPVRVAPMRLDPHTRIA